MMRSLNLLAVAALIGSASAAYTVKYETILVAEKLRKREAEIQREREALRVLKAEWAWLNRPSRLEELAKSMADLQPLTARIVIRPGDIPARGETRDTIGDRLETLLTGSIPTPAAPRVAPGRTPAAPGRPATPPKAGTTR